MSAGAESSGFGKQPMGEAKKPKKSPVAKASEDAMALETTGARVHARRDESAQATAHGQIVFLA